MKNEGNEDTRTLADITPVPGPELAAKAYRKALLTALANAKRDALHMAVSCFDVDTEMSPSDARAEILRDWRAGHDACVRVIDVLRAELDKLEAQS